MEKMVEKSFEKLFIKVYHKDHRMYHVMMIDKAWTARDLINSMILKSKSVLIDIFGNVCFQMLVC